MQDIVTKINILLQEICDIKLQNQKKNIFNDHTNCPKDTDAGNGQDDTRLIYNNASTHPLPDKSSIPRHHAPNPTHIPSIDDNAFAQRKPNPYALWSASPPESLSSSSSDKDWMDDNADPARYAWIKTGLPQKRVGMGEGESEMVGMGEGESEMVGERETRGGTEEERPGPSSSAVTKPSGPELDSEAGRC